VDIDGAVNMATTALVTGVLTTTAATVSNGGGQFNGAINVGVDDTGYDVKFFGATAGAYMLWDESADDLILGGAAGLSVNSTALVTGVLTTTAATVHTGGITMPDNAKAIFGAGSDLEIYHDGSDSFIKDAGVGNLKFYAGLRHQFYNADGSKIYIQLVGDTVGQEYVQLRYDNAEKLATTATGIDVTGTVVADGLTVDGASDGTAVTLLRADNNGITKKNTLRFEDTDTTTQNDQQIGRIEFYSNDTDHTGVDAVIEAVSATTALKELRFLTSDTANTPLSRLAIARNGDISFYEELGVTAKFFWDASAESLGIGTSSPVASVDIKAEAGAFNTTYNSFDGVNMFLRGAGTAGSGNYGSGIAWSVVAGSDEKMAAISSVQTESDANQVGLAFFTHVSTTGGDPLVEAMRIDSSGNVGIGTSSPDTIIHVMHSTSPTLTLERNSTSLADSNVIGRISMAHKDSNDAGVAVQIIGRAEGTAGAAGLAFNTGTPTSIAERVRIDSSGNVGIGTSSPAETLQIREDNAAGLGAVLSLANSNTSGLTGNSVGIGFSAYTVLAIDNAGYRGATIVAETTGAGNAHDLKFSTSTTSAAPTEAMRITSAGDLSLTGGGGIIFGDAGGTGTPTSNTLDDYEEGTWTPVVRDASSAGNTGGGTLKGYYTKIGRTVFLVFSSSNITTSGMTSGNDLFITGLPYTPATVDGTNYYTGALVMHSVTTSGNQVAAIQDAQDYIKLYEVVSGAAFEFIKVSDISSGVSDIRFSLTYEAA
jgi:hypothetical protein